jgi:uncharacterized protein (TIGR03435 family)
MNRVRPFALFIVGCMLIVAPLLSQTKAKPAFEVVSIKPTPPLNGGAIRIGGGARGDRFTLSGATLRMILTTAYSKAGNTPLSGQMQIINGPAWLEADRYDIEAKADCSGGAIANEQLQLMVQSMLEDRFQLKAHMETRELPIYALVVGKDGPKIKKSEDQSPSPFVPANMPQPCSSAANATPLPAPPPLPGPGQRGGPFDGGQMPRGAMMIMMNPTGMTLQATAAPIENLIGMLQQQLGRNIVNKTDLKGLYDFKLTFSPEGLQSPFGGRGGGPVPPAALPPGGGVVGFGPTVNGAPAEPVPSLFTAVQELGLKLESTKGPVEVLVIDSVQKPSEN